MSQGYYALALPSTSCPSATSIPDTVLSPSLTRWLELSVDGVVMLPRQVLAPAPVAARAQLSADAQAFISLVGQAGTLNDEANPIDWSRLKGVPAHAAVGYAAGTGVTIAGGSISVGPGAVTNTMLADGIATSKLTGTIPTSSLLGTIPTSSLLGTIPTSSLSGTITNAQLGGGITLDKLASQSFAGDLSASGKLVSGSSLKVAGDTAPCGSGNAGAIRFTAGTPTGVFEACNGTAWMRFGDPPGTQTNPGRSCLDILNKMPTATSGDYYILPAGQSTPFQAWCDMSTDGGGYTLYPITGGASSCRYTDNNGCKALGMDIVMPRSKGHWLSMSAKYGVAYFQTIPGVYNDTGGTSYVTCAMRSPAAYGSGCSNWRVGDGGKWWVRDTAFTEPNGDYTAGCWLGITANALPYTVDATTINGGGTWSGIGFNDGNCGYCVTTYLCSTNDKP